MRNRSMLSTMLLGTLLILACSAGVWQLSQNGHTVSVKYPYVWRDSDMYPREHATCNVLIALGSGIKLAIEDSKHVGELESIEDIVRALKIHGYIEEPSGGPSSHGLTNDAWGNPLKIRTQLIEKKSKTVLIYSDTPNAFPSKRNERYNLFVELTINSDGSVSMLGTTVPETGRIVMKEY